MIWIFEQIKNLANSFINLNEKKKKEIAVFSLYFIVLFMIILYEFEFSTGPIRIFKPHSDEFNDLLYLLVTGNLRYVMCILDDIKYNVFFLFIDSIHLFFNDTMYLNIENSLLDLNLFMLKNSSSDINHYLQIKDIENTLKFDLLMYECTN